MSETLPPYFAPAAGLQERDFLKGPDARPLRILSEYLEPLSHFRRQRIRDTIVFFGSARIREDGPLGEYYRDARTLAAMVTTGRRHSASAPTGLWFVRAAARASWKRPIAAQPMPEAKPSA